MTHIEKKLERVMEIGDWQGCFRVAVYNCWYDSDDPFEDPYLMSALNKSLALWLEFNEIVEEIQLDRIKKRNPIKAKVVACDWSAGYVEGLAIEATLKLRPNPKEADIVS